MPFICIMIGLSASFFIVDDADNLFLMQIIGEILVLLHLNFENIKIVRLCIHSTIKSYLKSC